MSEHFPILKFSLPEEDSPQRANFLPYPKSDEGDPEHLLRVMDSQSHFGRSTHQLRWLSTNVPSDDISYIETAEIGAISIRFKDGTMFYAETTTRNTDGKFIAHWGVPASDLGIERRVAFFGTMRRPDSESDSFGAIISIRISAHLYPAAGSLRLMMGDPVLLSVEDDGPFIEDIETEFFLGDQTFEYGFMPKVAVRLMPKETE